LLVAHLHVARGHVVDDRVAEHVIHRTRARDVAAAAADDHGEFRFVVDLHRGGGRGQAHHVMRPDHAFAQLAEDDRPRVFLGHGLAEHGAREFGGVRAVVASDAEQAAQRARQRCAQRDDFDR
jgi:hypothetical protein